MRSEPPDVLEAASGENGFRGRPGAAGSWKQIRVALHPEGVAVGQIVPPQSSMARQQHQQFAAETAAVSGETKRDINRHLSRAEALGEDLLKVAGTSLDKGVEFDLLKAVATKPPLASIARSPVAAR